MKNLCGGKSEGTGCNIGERKTFKVEIVKANIEA